MTIIDTGPYTTPILVYNAPIDEKTKKIREMFKVDEKTGYPEHYKWRSMARLGSSYLPADPFKKFDPYDPKTSVSDKITLVGFSGLICLATHLLINFTSGVPYWSRPQFFLGTWAISGSLYLWYRDRAEVKQGMKNGIIVDYTQKHPERFGSIYRPKVREVLFYHVPCR